MGQIIRDGYRTESARLGTYATAHTSCLAGLCSNVSLVLGRTSHSDVCIIRYYLYKPHRAGLYALASCSAFFGIHNSYTVNYRDGIIVTNLLA